MAITDLVNQGGTQITTAKWAQYLGRSGGTGGGGYGWTSGTQLAETIDVEWAEYLAGGGGKVLSQILGDAYRAGDQLKRDVPWRHPFRTNLFCTRITSVQGIQWKAKLNGALQEPLSRYDRVRLNLVFEAVPYSVLTDDELRAIYPLGGGLSDESKRFVSIDPSPSVELISRKEGHFEWADGGGTGPVIGQTFPGEVSQRLVKRSLRVVWWMVPVLWVMDSSGLVMPNVEAALGKVNSAAFWGFPAGTLLMISAKPVWLPSPFPMRDLNSFLPQRLINVEMTFLHFDPPYGNVANRGHNLAPFRGDNLWWLIRSGGTGAPPYPGAAFVDIFKKAT